MVTDCCATIYTHEKKGQLTKTNPQFSKLPKQSNNKNINNQTYLNNMNKNK